MSDKVEVKVKEGRSVRLDRMTYTSVHGGTYDISHLSEEDRKRVLNTKGVTKVGAKTTKKSGGDK